MRATLTAIAVAAAIGCGPATKARVVVKQAPLTPLPTAAYAHYLQGRVAMHEGRFARAVLRFRAAAAAAPGEAPIRVALIDALYRAGRRDEALVEADRAQRRFATDVEVWLTSGRVLRAARERTASLRAYRRAIYLAPEDERGYVGAAGIWIAVGKPAEAERIYRSLLARVPDSITAHYRLGERLLATRRTKTAITHLRKVLAFEPDHIEARVGLARGLRALGRQRQAIEVLRVAFDRSSGDPEVGDQLFRQLLDVGDRRGAVELLSVLDRDDLGLQTRVSFGYLYLQIGENDRALALANGLAARAQRNGDVRLLRAQTLDALGRTREGIPALLELRPAETTYPECRAYAGELLSKLGDHDRALAVVDEAMVTHAEHIDLIVSRSLVFERRGEPAQARAIFEAALHKRPANADLLYAFASFEDRIGRTLVAESLAGKILELDPDHPTALNFLGYSLADRNADLPRASRLLRRAVALSPGNGYVLDSLGWLLFRQGRLDEALTTLRRAARLAPREPEILWHLAELQLARGNRGKALDLLRQARALKPEGRVRKRIEARLQALRPG